jgi:hypothetical protein
LGNKERTELLKQAKAEGFQPSEWYQNPDLDALRAEIQACEDELQELNAKLHTTTDIDEQFMLRERIDDLRVTIRGNREEIENPIIQSDDEWLLQAFAENRLLKAKGIPTNVGLEAYRDSVLAIAKSGNEPDIDALETQIAKCKSEIIKHVVTTGSSSAELHITLHRLQGEIHACFMLDDELANIVKQSQSPWQSAPKLIDAFQSRFMTDSLPKPYVLSGAFRGLEIGPGMICVMGGGPGVGKTAASMQIISELRKNHPELPVYIANAESSFDSIMIREIVRLTQIPSSKIRRCELNDEEKAKIVAAAVELRKWMSGIVWLTSEFNYAQLCATSTKPRGLLVCDYLHKFAPSTEETRAGITMIMSALRQFANNGWSVLALSAINRTTTGGPANLAAFRDSSEIEYNADAAYILERRIQDNCEYVRLNCLKNRHDKPTDLNMDFHPETMEFTERFEEMGEIADQLWGGDDE